MNPTTTNAGALGAVAVHDRDGVRHVVLDRPEKKNALTDQMWTGLADALGSASEAGCGAVLITGRGPAFTAGNDLKDFLEHPPRDEAAPVFRFLRSLVSLDVPLIAAVRGAAIGIGTTLLLHCDLVYASPTVKLKLPFVDLGLVPEAASSVLLPRLVGRARAGRILLLAETLDAEQALDLGLVSKIVADENLDVEAEAAARAIAAKPRQAIRETKRLLTHDRAEIVAAIEREGASFRRQLASPEAQAAMASFFKR
jgi:enoyl-CoA hydratase/carnithine racemase